MRAILHGSGLLFMSFIDHARLRSIKLHVVRGVGPGSMTHLAEIMRSFPSASSSAAGEMSYPAQASTLLGPSVVRWDRYLDSSRAPPRIQGPFFAFLPSSRRRHNNKCTVDRHCTFLSLSRLSAARTNVHDASSLSAGRCAAFPIDLVHPGYRLNLLY